VADNKAGAGDLGEQLVELRINLGRALRNAAVAKARGVVAKAAIDRFDAFATAVTTVPDGGTLSPLAIAATREHLHSGDGGLDVLFVELDSAGGETITHQSLWHQSNHVVVMGAVAVSWMLLDLPGGHVKRAGSMPLVGASTFNLADGAIEEPEVHPPARR
jgi:hypothetical protein